jgi:hypothetical protein
MSLSAGFQRVASLHSSVRLYFTTQTLCESSFSRQNGSASAHRRHTPRNNNTSARTTHRDHQRCRRHAPPPTTSDADLIHHDLLLDKSHQYQHHGIFQSQHIKPFPVRAAIDIGTGGVVSLCIGRVDARAGAVQRLMYQTQLPLYLEAFHGGATATTSAFTLSERTVDDIKNKMRVLHGVMRRNAFEGLSERAAVLSWPLCRAANAHDLAHALTREFKVDVRVLGDSFHVEWPRSMTPHSGDEPAVAVSRATHTETRGDRLKPSASSSSGSSGEAPASSSSLSSSPSRGGDKLKALLRSVSTVSDDPTTSATTTVLASSRAHKRTGTSGDADATAGTSSPSDDPRAQVDVLAFLAHAAVSQCVAPQRLLVLNEDPQRGVRLLALDTSPAADVADLLEMADSADAVAKLKQIAFGDADSAASDVVHDTALASPSPSAEVVPVDEGGLRLVEHTLPVDVATAHRYCITHIQRRPAASYGLHTSSPNPLLSEEFAALRGLLMEMIARSLPRWARRKSLLGGMIVATSHNGGLFNAAARVAQQTSLSLEHLEVHAQHHFCGLTDVLLAEQFPNPLTVLPSAALTAAILRALDSPRMAYVPEVNTAVALLVQPSLWLASRVAEVRRRLSADPFYATETRAQRGRAFERPHRKDNPTAAPEATWVRGERQNPLSYPQSTKGM